MNQNLPAALDWIIKAEGGYVNNPADPGGETNFGITAKFLNTLQEARNNEGSAEPAEGGAEHIFTRPGNTRKSAPEPYNPGRESPLRGTDYRLVAVKDLTEAQARAIYQKYFWDAMGCGTLPPGLDIAVFDCAVNQGPGRARLFLSQCGNSALRFLKLRKDFYLGLNNATEETFEKGWMNRLFDLAWLIRPLVNN